MSKLSRTARKQLVAAQARGTSVQVRDGYENVKARLGLNNSVLAGGGQYVANYTTNFRQQLENIYRSSWIIGRAVDAVAEDMTREGIEIVSKLAPEDIKKVYRCISKLRVWQSLTDALKWSRLYGGSIAVIMVDGQDPTEPLRLSTVGPDQFKGVYVLDRWMVDPSLNVLVSDLGPHLGKPKFYKVTANAPAMSGAKIHYTRIIRMEGVTLPYWQQQQTNGWGMSIVERIYDRLVAYDSTSQGTAQLVYKAYLRNIKVKGLREILARGGPGEQALTRMFEMVREMQTNEGITLLDSEDEFQLQSYTFSGLSDVMQSFAEQLSGATEIPLIRLFGQTPHGLNANGDADIRNYYDKIKQQQVDVLSEGIEKIVALASQSVGVPSDDFEVQFNPLWQMDGQQRSTIAQNTTNSINAAFENGLVSRKTALKELKESSKETGMWSNISDEEIATAEDEPPKPDVEMNGDPNADPLGLENQNELPQGLGQLDPVDQLEKVTLQ